jgi:hypothetical protein
VADSDTSAFLLGADYKASDRLTLRATSGTIGGSSVDQGGGSATSFVFSNYVLGNLNIGPSGTSDVDLTYFNFRIEYQTADDATFAIDYTFGDEQDAGPSGNSGSGIILSLEKAFA